MGTFNTVLVECPECGGLVEFQSKAGPREMETYTVKSAPPEILTDISGKTARCWTCGKSLTLRLRQCTALDVL